MIPLKFEVLLNIGGDYFIVFIQGLINICDGEPLLLPLVHLMETSSQQW